MCLRGVMVPHSVEQRLVTMKVIQPLIMSWYGVLITLMMDVSIIQCFVFDMDLKLDSALQKGGALSRNTGSYLYNSFRTEVLTPAFAAVLKELKSNHQSDVIVEGTLFLLAFAMGAWMLVIWLRTKSSVKVMKEFLDKGQPMKGISVLK